MQKGKRSKFSGGSPIQLSPERPRLFCLLEAMFAALILFHYFLFVLINSHNKVKRRSAMRLSSQTRCANAQPQVLLTAATLLGVRDRMRISGSASRCKLTSKLKV